MNNKIPQYNKPTKEEWVKLFNENFRLCSLKHYQNAKLLAAVHAIDNIVIDYPNIYNKLWLVRCLRDNMTFEQMIRFHVSMEEYE